MGSLTEKQKLCLYQVSTVEDPYGESNRQEGEELKNRQWTRILQ